MSSGADLEATLRDVWRSILGPRDFGARDSFFDLGGDSLRALAMLVEVERRLGAVLPTSILVTADTIEALAAEIRRAAGGSRWRSLVPLRPGGSAPPLFLAHAAGGSILGYAALAERLAPDRPVYALQPPVAPPAGRLPIRVEEIAAHFVREIREASPDGPYLLAGYSYGGLLAYEMALQLLREGARVPLLALLDTQRPLFRNFLARHRRELARRTPVEALRYLIRKSLGRVREEWKGLGLALFGNRRGPTSDPAEHRVRASFATRRYRPRPYPGRLLVVEGAACRAADWCPLAFGPFEVRRIECDDHARFMDPRNHEAIARILDAMMDA